MTTSPVASITDEQLAEIEALSLEAEAFDWAPDIGMSHSETVYACHVGPSVIRDLIARLRAAEKELTEVTGSLPYSTYTDPPDGGGVSIPEQVRRMAKDAKRYLWVRERVGVLPEDCKTVWVLMDGCRMHDIERHETDQAIDLAMEQQP